MTVREVGRVRIVSREWRCWDGDGFYVMLRVFKKVFLNSSGFVVHFRDQVDIQTLSQERWCRTPRLDDEAHHSLILQYSCSSALKKFNNLETSPVFLQRLSGQ